ncbi:MAG: hypothetical protein ACRDNM_17175, partial [Gaiellaceae bacterium]
MNLLLVVVGDASPETIRLALARRPAHVRVLATSAVGPIDWLSNAEEGARMRAGVRALEAERALDGLVDVMSSAGGVDPVEAVADALAEFPAHEIVVTGAAADAGLERALSVFGLPVGRVGPPPSGRARIYGEVRELAGGRNAGKLFAFIVGMNVALFAAAIVLSLFALLILWLVGAF